MIQTFDLARRYGAFTAVDGVNMKIPAGEIFGFLGLNGAGKTTVMRMICGLLRPSRGYAQVGPAAIRGPQDTHRLMPLLSFVSQEMKFHEQTTLAELLTVYARLADAPVQRGIDFARRVGVPLNRICARFSPGQQRKAQLAIALLKQPRYLLLDEPSAGLDPHGVAEMRDILRELNHGGTTIFFSSHILSEVQTLCSTVSILHQGKIRFHGSLKDTHIIPVPERKEIALSVLNQHQIEAKPCPDGLEVHAAEQDIPALLNLLTNSGISTGAVQPVNLEHIFQKVTLNDQEGIV